MPVTYTYAPTVIEYPATSMSSATTNVWQTWAISNETATSGTFTLSQSVWYEWTIETGAVREVRAAQTPEEIAAEQERQRVRQAALAVEVAEAQRRAAEWQRERAVADQVAEELLRSMLNETQLAELTAKDEFDVHVYSKDRAAPTTYTIRRGSRGNVIRKHSKGKTRYCIHPVEEVPDADTMLAQKLLLETNEKEFLRIANATLVA